MKVRVWTGTEMLYGNEIANRGILLQIVPDGNLQAINPAAPEIEPVVMVETMAEDEQGTLTYEGDILQVVSNFEGGRRGEEMPCVIRRENGGFIGYDQYGKVDWSLHEMFGYMRGRTQQLTFRVIGNIYENPDAMIPSWNKKEN